MQIDSYTVLLFGLAVKGLLAALFFLFWLKDRQPPLAWWCATLTLGASSTFAFALRGFTADFLAIGVGVALLILAVGSCWQGARTFHGRPPQLLPLIGATAFWL